MDLRKARRRRPGPATKVRLRVRNLVTAPGQSVRPDELEHAIQQAMTASMEQQGPPAPNRRVHLRSQLPQIASGTDQATMGTALGKTVVRAIYGQSDG